jgi:6-phosphogluconolactonase (cycloisomerase 2 family)
VSAPPIRYAAKRRRVSAQTAVLAVLAAAGLAGIAAVLWVTWGPATSSFSGFVYVESNRLGRNTVLAYRFRDNRFEPIGEFSTGGAGVVDYDVEGSIDAQDQVLFDPKRRLLYAVNQGSDSVAVFRLQRNGRPVAVRGSPFASAGKAPGSLALAGPFLIVVDKAQDTRRDLHADPPTYHAFRVTPGGALSPVGTPFRSDPFASPTAAFPLTPNLLVSTEESGPFRALRVGADGSITQGPNSPLAPEKSIFRAGYDGARWSIGLARHPTRPLIYANQSSTRQLLVYRFDPSGRLTFLRSVRNTHSRLPCWTVVSADGERLFTANAGNGSVTSFSLSDPERPRRVQAFALRAAANPWGLALSPDGRTLFVVDARADTEAPLKRGNRLHAIHVDTDGKLRELRDSPVKLPVSRDDSSPLGIAVVPAAELTK